jgi:hypothetical protein
VIVAVYTWKVKPGFEEQFQEGWRLGTERGVREFGSGGSALCKMDDGTWMGVARWSDRGALERFRARSPDPEQVRLLTESVDEAHVLFEGVCLNDLWTPLSPA